MKNDLSAWQLLRGYFRTYRRSVLLCLLSPLLFTGMHLLGMGSFSELGYSLLLTGICLFLAWVSSFSRYVTKLLCLRDAARNLMPSAESIPAGDGRIESAYRDLAIAYQQQQNDLLAQAAALDRERTDYYTLWMHQIKTPIAAMDLMAQSDTPLDRELLRQELFKVEQYADAALSYQRLQSLGKDLELAPISLYPLCCSVVRKLRTLFLYRKITLRMDSFEENVLSDAKWLAMVLTQVLTNSLKYTPEGGEIHIWSPRPQVLCIADNGIGIRAEDVPRVFDRGFTGQIGRSSDKSTGIGLYLCRETCQRLGHRISIASTLGQSTTVTINLRRECYEPFA